MLIVTPSGCDRSGRRGYLDKTGPVRGRPATLPRIHGDSFEDVRPRAPCCGNDPYEPSGTVEGSGENSCLTRA